MELWSWVLTAAGASTLYLAGRGTWHGWAVGIFTQSLWLVYAVSTRQYGFIFSVFVYGPLYVINLRKTLKRMKREREADEK